VLYFVASCDVSTDTMIH